MDTPFPTWLRFAYRGGGERYKPYDMNMPQILPSRPREHYRCDPPLSVHGKVCAGLIGLGMHNLEKMPYVIYSSPELRCVETASGMIDRLNAPHVSIRIEPALAEWPMLSSQDLPKYWLTPNQHMELGHPIDLSYRPFLSVKDFPREETPEQYMQRLAAFYMFARQSTNDEMLVIVTNPPALLFVKGYEVSTVRAILSVHEETRPLSMHALHIENNRQVYKDPLLIPLTPTVTQARDERITK
ncbi:unnamed protein product, partial [Mesorhabditis belari]|uniref:Uncharacterized protein n=1 Tax=Mesorhabditis belari TaxID=2138241 RepID=A0AAF3FEE9_9BILA